MKKRVKVKSYKRLFISAFLLIVIVFCIIKLIDLQTKTKDNQLYTNKSFIDSSINIINESNNIENITTNNTQNIEDVKEKKGKKRESRAIPLAKGEKSENSLPVLMYHFFFDDSEGAEAPNSNYMPVSSFEAQLKYLSENDFYYPTWEEVADFVDGKIDLPDKSVVLTMDDGDDSVFELALPLLEKYNVPATSFIITGNFDESDLKKYSDSILDLQSHTEDMHRGGGNLGHGGIFLVLSTEEATEDLKKSIQKLGGNSGALAYPFGDCSEKTKDAVKKAGFKVAFTTVNDKVKPGMDKYELPRMRMFSDIKLAGFKYCVE